MAPNNTTDEPVVDWTRVLGGALAAVSSAVLLSTLGVIGTIVGAALGSIVVSVATSLYARGLHKSRQRMAVAQEAALRRVGVAQAEVRRAKRRGPGATDAHLKRADESLAEAHEELETDPESSPLLTRLRRLPWRRVALGAALTFVVALAAITIFELVAGRPVASFTGGSDSDHGTSIGDARQRGQAPSPSPSGPTSPTSSPTDGSSPSGPTSSPSESPSSSPTETPSSTPASEEPSPSAPESTPAD
jgi:hypothetical protein